MIKAARNTLLIRYFWGFMSLYFLNCCVDSADVQPNYVPENLTYNDQESIIEIIVEKLLGYDNAIAEYDDNDTNENIAGKITFSLGIFVVPSAFFHINPKFLTLKNQYLSGQNLIILIPFFEINTPPPEVLFIV
ncbi:hypothetical protein [Flavobacterium caseinilyticum]|uniref:Uncharacterized protein n=1 Tax=Flavobacterium caseinilyticum TaxID=2541732 RepID=A0A4R5ALI1_9FLAO|nr:hypothetical protein [Flavobacterium caseinilyticum]TDD73778.1 hypothetical protein E0F89_16710 [Flavobacterium caseinilyticum]